MLKPIQLLMAYALAEDVVMSSLDGVSYQNSASNGLNYLSLMGGAPIMISGSMMSPTAQQNQPVFAPKWISNAQVYGPLLSQNDEFNSNAMAGKVGYTTPSVMTLMGSPLSSFDGAFLPTGVYPSNLSFDFKVLNTLDNWYVICGTPQNCAVQYKRDYTGLLYDVSSPNVFRDQLIEFHVNAKATQDVNGTPADALFPFRSMSLGSTLVDQAELYDDGDRLAAWSHDVLPGFVGSEYPGIDSTPNVLFHNGYLQTLPSATHCNFAGDDCYTVKTHARIDSVSAASGYISGGQQLSISGVGLNSTNIEVLVDGVQCAVTSATSTTINCLTGAKSAVSATGAQPGQPGLTRKKTLEDGTVTSIDLMTALNHFDLIDDTNKEDITGWFTAPTTGLYRFYISCDNACSFSIDATNPYVAGATNSPSPVVVAYRNWSVSWRSYWYNKNEGQKSDWISLTEGEAYYVAASTKVFKQTLDMTVSLEIQPTDPAQLNSTHPKLAKSIQQLAKDPTNTPEQWQVTVTNPDAGTFKLNLLNPTTKPSSYWQSASISASASAASFKSALSSYYSSNFGMNIAVTKEMFDASSALTTDATLAVTVVYTVTLQKQIFGMSANAISVTKGTTLSTFAVASPSIGGIKSSAPVNGTFAVQCTDQQNIVYTSKDINYNAGPFWIGKAIMDSIPFLVDKVQVHSDYRYGYPENGLSFLLQFTGLDYTAPMCSIVAGSGLYPLTGSQLVDNNTLIQTYGNSVFFEPITLDFLTSDAQSPQVLVKVDGISALCANVNCDYTYVPSIGSVTDQSLSGNTLTITGTSLPTTDELFITLGPVKCIVTSNTATSITCDLETNAVSGSWIVSVTSPNGLIPNEITTELLVPVAATSVSPNTSINYLGGDVLTISGDNFGTDASVVTVTFDDATKCVLLTVSMDTITCMPNRFTTNYQSSTQVTIAINAVSDSSLSVSMVTDLPSGIQMTPTSVSPVLKTDLTITLQQDFPYTLDAESITATLLSPTDSTLNKQLYIVSVDDATKTIIVKFPGAKSGEYIVQISTTQQGRIMSDDLQLSVSSKITGVSPLSGSIYGGALVTITGENFSNEPLDNPVKIGNNYCYVITSSPTQITCRTDLLQGQAAEDALLLVFLKTSEEAQSQDDILFTYVAPSATVTDIAASFNSALATYQVIVSGTGLDATTELVIDGITQSLVSFTSTSATFNVVGLNGVTTSDVKVFTSQGYPEGMEITHTLTFLPTLLSFSPSAGSSAGSWVTVTGSGFGPSTLGLNIKAGTQVLCSQVEIVSYGVLKCLTNPIAFTSSTALSMTINGAAVASTSSATYSQSVLYPVTSSSLSSVTITFTGSNFPTDGSYTASATFGGVTASSTTIVSSTSVEATWTDTGIAAASEVPVLIFTSSDLSHWHIAQRSNTITHTLTVTQSSAVSCSFGGGCQYSVTADGLYATLLNEQNSLEVCASSCILRPDLSDSSQATCDLPPLATAYSVENFKIKESAVLSATVFPANSVLTDDDMTIDYVDTKTTGCNFGMSFKQGHVAVLDEAKVFLGRITSRSVYVNNLQFQGSNDNWSTFDLLHTFGADVHEGWNQIKFDTTKPEYNSYRFYGLVKGSCRVTEFRLTGVEAIADSNPTYDCTPYIVKASVKTTDVLETVTYDASYTPKLTSINPRYGSVLGGTTVTLTGTNLLGSGTSSVAFDNRVCNVQSQTATQIVCVTSDKPYVPDTPLVTFSIAGLGNVATQGLIYRYVSLWSEPQTWGYDLPPLLGESVSIPKGQHLLVDVNPPVLNAIIVEGSLIFAPNADPTHLATFDAHYIMINGGYMEVGTTQFPYTSKIQITMYSDRFDPYLPMYGNKVIGVRFGTLDMHGIPRDFTWTRLAQTALQGATSITLVDSPDWQAGEEIVIATTSFSNEESETRIITSVVGNVISFAEPLKYMHLSEVPTYNGIEMPMQAEVGLLTRNVLFRGDPIVSPRDQYGAHIMVSSPGDETCIGRITYIELKDVGQAFKLGRYPIHFHMIGTVHQSIVQGNAIHQTYNRAVTTHGVHYFKVINNVAFNTMGHTYFVEDAIESKNIYEHNLAVQVRASMSLLNSDQTPAGFWITFPDNIFTNNHVAGSDSHGFWFDLQFHSMGPSFDVNVCGFREKLGQFVNNTAHSVSMYGFRIWHMHLPQMYPCNPVVYDSNWVANGQTDPYWQNPQVPSVFENFVGYKCLRNGAITERTGAVTFKNFRIADSGIAGVEFSLIENVEDNMAFLDGGLIVGNTHLNDEDNILQNSKLIGFWGPRTENMTVTGVTFFNFDNDQFSAAFSTCSHCFHPAATDSGGRTLRVANLTFDDTTVPRKIWFGFPYREIIHDTDGSLLGMGANAYVAPYFPHNLQPECTFLNDTFNGIACDPSVQVRKVVFYGYAPGSFNMQDMKVSQWDDAFQTAIKADNATYQTYLQDVDHTYFSRVEQRAKKDPMYSWPVPMVTGHNYRLHWGEGIDFTTMKYSISNRWQPTDLNIKIMTNFTDVRASINITDQDGKQIANRTFIDLPEAELVNGDNVIYNQTEVREFHFVVNGKNKLQRTDLIMNGYRCVFNCTPTVVVVPISNETSLWSVPATWPSGKVPEDGEDVEIIPGANILLDIDTAILGNLVINGRLTFLNNLTNPLDLTLHAHTIFVHAGELLIGNETNPFSGTATIKLYGAPTDPSLAFSDQVEGGNKVLAITGLAKIYGQQRAGKSRLRATVLQDAKFAQVEAGLDWKAGDKIAFLPTTTQWQHTDYNQIVSYDIASGNLTLLKPLKFYHWGDIVSTGAQYNGVDMRGEVILLSRNVRIVGDDTDSWGGQVVVSDILDINGAAFNGQLVLDSVEIYNCSQKNTFKSAIRFEGAYTNWQSVTNSAIHGSLGWPFSTQSTSNILIDSTTMIGGRAIGLQVLKTQNLVMNNLVVSDIAERPELAMYHIIDKTACVDVCGYFEPEYGCGNITLTNSVVSGCKYAGFIVPGHACGQSATQTLFKNNVAHSIQGPGAIVFPDPTDRTQVDCYETSYFSAYKNDESGIVTHFNTNEVRASYQTLIDNRQGVSLTASGSGAAENGPKALNVLQNSIIYGETAALDCPNKAYCYCKDKFAFMSMGSNRGAQPIHQLMISHLPFWKVGSYGRWAAETLFTNVTFSGFASNTTACGMEQNIFQLNLFGSDFIPVQRFNQITFNDVADDAIAYIMDPPQWWANPSDCIEFPCSAPKNAVFDFQNVKYSGSTRPSFKDVNFQIIADTPGASETFNNCQYKDQWNAWRCVNGYIGQLVFRADDSNQESRSVAPVYVTNTDKNFTNVLNSMMDHMWDGFYTGQMHKSQFVSFVETDQNYTVEYTSTPFNMMHYSLRANRGQIKVHVPYWNAGSYYVYIDGKYIPNTPWDKEAGVQSELTGLRGCGENRYVGVKNYLEFILTAGCELQVLPVDSITSSVRMQWTMAEFYAAGGVVSFTDRVAAALGIHASTIKTVAVYKGSVVVDFNVLSQDPTTLVSDPLTSSSSTTTLRSLKTQLNTLIKSSTASSVFGAPILSASTDGTALISDPNYNPGLNPTPVSLPTAPEIQNVTITNTIPSVTTASDQSSDQPAPVAVSASNQQLLWILLVVVLLCMCCFGVGTAVICAIKLVKKPSKPKVEVVESEIDLHPQFHPTQDIELDIFSKKRDLKENEDFTTNQAVHLNTSDKKLISTDSQPSEASLTKV